MGDCLIRLARRGDENAIFDLILALAVYEKAPEEVVNTPVDLATHLFEDKICWAFVAELDNTIVGFALFYTSYSTWKGKCLYLEDLFVRPEYRGLHIGGKLFDAVVEEAKIRKVKRMDWQVLDWNQIAIRFYTDKQAELTDNWLNGRLYF
jgi:GNAT superfamily N-acetyltransferase